MAHNSQKSNLKIADVTPVDTTNALYNIAGALYWNGSVIMGSAIANGTVTDSTLRWNGANWVENTTFKTNSTAITINSAIVNKVRTISTSGASSVLNTDYIVLCDTTTAAGTMTLNLFGSPATGSTLIIKDSTGSASTNTITIVPAAGNIDGMATYVINMAYESVTLVYSGTQYNIV